MKNCSRHADTVYVTPDMFGVYRNCEMRTPWLCGTNKDFYELVRRKHGSNKGTPLSPPARKHRHAAHVSRYTRRTIADRVREEIWIPCSSADTSKTKEHAPQPRDTHTCTDEHIHIHPPPPNPACLAPYRTLSLSLSISLSSHAHARAHTKDTSIICSWSEF